MGTDHKEKLIRVLQILEETDEKSPMNATQILKYLEEEYQIEQVDRRSVYRDIKMLQFCGYEIYQCADKKMGWYETLRKNIYLIKIFVLLHAPFGQRMQFVKEIRQSIDGKLDTGMTIDEVIEELGEASALTEEYNDIGMRQQTKEYVWMVLWILVGICLGVLLIIDGYTLYTGYHEINQYIAPTGYEWIDFRPKAGGTWGKVIVESIGFCICLGNVIYHFKRRRKAKKDNEL